MFRYILNVLCILLISTTFAWGINIEHCYSKEQTLESTINEICDRYNEDVNLVKAIIRVESVFNPNARSKKGDCKGLMQLSRGTARKYDVENVFDPEDNIEGGVKYLQVLRQIFGNDLKKVIAAYNTGEENVLRRGIQPKVKKYVNLVLTAKEKYDKRNY